MQKLLSLPPNLVNCFHEITHTSKEEYFCTSDPENVRLGSGGGTAWLLESCRREENPEMDMSEWLGINQRILLHAGGQSRRLPSYAPSGKILTPIPVFRWARGQKISQDLLSLQLPLYEKIMGMAPSSFHTLVVSGDVYIYNQSPLPEIPEADVVCYGLWSEASLAVNHGVFAMRRDTPDRLDFMLQKPSEQRLNELLQTHFYLMDIGVWLLSDRAVRALMNRSRDRGENGNFGGYDLYSEFGFALGENPSQKDDELNALKVAILPMNDAVFYHYGTSRELISSTLSIQNIVQDQRIIMHKGIKPHPAMFVQNAIVDIPLNKDNSEVWIENSYIGRNWRLSNHHIITGVPKNDWNIEVPENVCIDVVPIGSDEFVIRPYGYCDKFKGELACVSTMFMEHPICKWIEERTLSDIDMCVDIQDAKLFPVVSDVEQMELVLRWMLDGSDLEAGREIWITSEKLSANEISAKANLVRLVEQRNDLRRLDLLLLANNQGKSIFYQVDLMEMAHEWFDGKLSLPREIPDSDPLLKRIHDAMFRSKVLELRQNKELSKKWEYRAFDLLREGLTGNVLKSKQNPSLGVYRDQIVWGRSPVRIDVAGGWTDTPPYCLYAGGNVVNLAIELNGQPPLQVYIKPSEEYKITLRSIDLGAREVVSTWDELRAYCQIGSPFSIPKAALSLAGFLPDFCGEKYVSLEEQLRAFGCGIEITLLSAIPAGSGLGTSSVLGGTVLGAISDFCNLYWDKNEICIRTLVLEQLLTTGGGWQDQYGGIFHGIKLLQTSSGFEQVPQVSWLPEYIFRGEYASCHLLYYTGITRTAKGILGEIVKNMFLNSTEHLNLLSEMKQHAIDLYKSVQKSDFDLYGKLVAKSWSQNKQLDKGTNPPQVDALIRKISDYILGAKLPGAGGGGYLYMVAKDDEAARRIRRVLQEHPCNRNSRFVDMSLSDIGLQVSRS